MRRGLVVAQVGLACVLLIGAGLLLASFRKLLAVDPGFKSEGVITVSTAPPQVKYTSEKLRPFMDRTLEVIRSIPGVRSAGATNSIPFGGRFDKNVILAEGYVMKPGESVIAPMQVNVSPGYFETMGTPLKRGRFFNEHDSDTAPRVAIVDERLAQKFWPGADPIGKRLLRTGRRRHHEDYRENEILDGGRCRGGCSISGSHRGRTARRNLLLLFGARGLIAIHAGDKNDS